MEEGTNKSQFQAICIILGSPLPTFLRFFYYYTAFTDPILSSIWHIFPLFSLITAVWLEIPSISATATEA
jgi:hypothetical protein